MKTLVIYATMIAGLLFATAAIGAERETYYSSLICETVYHGSEDSLESGLRPDCQTDFVIMEFDWAKSPKHYECIGQALIYSGQTGKIPVCILLARDDDELAFGLSLDFDQFGVILRVIDTRPYDPQ